MSHSLVRSFQVSSPKTFATATWACFPIYGIAPVPFRKSAVDSCQHRDGNFPAPIRLLLSKATAAHVALASGDRSPNTVLWSNDSQSSEVKSIPPKFNSITSRPISLNFTASSSDFAGCSTRISTATLPRSPTAIFQCQDDIRAQAVFLRHLNLNGLDSAFFSRRVRHPISG